MSTIGQILLILLSAFLIWQLYAFVRHNPGMFSKENLNKSFYTLGLLCLFLMGLIALMVFILKH